MQTRLNIVTKVNDIVVFIYSITVHSCYNQILHIFVWNKKRILYKYTNKRYKKNYRSIINIVQKYFVCFANI